MWIFHILTEKAPNAMVANAIKYAQTEERINGFMFAEPFLPISGINAMRPDKCTNFTFTHNHHTNTSTHARIS